MHYLARRVGDEPGLRNALQGSELLNTLAWSLVWQRGTSARDAELAIQLATVALRDAPNNGPIWHTLVRPTIERDAGKRRVTRCASPTDWHTNRRDDA